MTSDHLGSPRITTDANGDIDTRRDFMPFGEEIDSTHTSQRTATLNYASDEIRQKFTSYERDNETDLDFAQARMFGSSLGRFTSPDPTLLSVNGFNPQSWNRYIYVLNNPHAYTDPLGLWEVRTETIYKKNKDGTYKTYKNGERKIKRVIVTVVKSKEGDDAATLASQLGLSGKDAEKFIERIGDSDNVRLSNQKGLVGQVFGEVERGLTKQENWMAKNNHKLKDLNADGKYGPSDNDCSGTSCKIGLRDNKPKIGTNVLDPRLDREARNVAESDARVGDIVRYANDKNLAKHFANFIFRNDDGTPMVFSKSGESGPYERRLASDLETDLYGTIRGRRKNHSGYYRRR